MITQRKLRPWARFWAPVVAATFALSIAATPAQALAAHGSGLLSLSDLSQVARDVQRHVSSLASLLMPAGHAISVAPDAGLAYNWEGSHGDTNTGNGNKLTTIPIVGWTAKGGLPVSMELYHNSQGSHNSELGWKWSHSYDVYLVPEVNAGTGRTDIIVNWGDQLATKYTKEANGSFTPPAGVHDSLVANVVNNVVTSYDLTTHGQVKFHFTNPNTTGFHLASTQDLNANTITVNRNGSDLVTSVVDPTSRTLTIAYDVNNRISTITDPASRVWTITYSSGDLYRVTYPTINSTNPYEQFTYNSDHCITTHKDRRGNDWTFSWNSDKSLAWEKDPLLNQTSYTYALGTTTITDANGRTTKHFYSGGKLTGIEDALTNTESYVYDSDMNRTQVTDRRGKVWDYTFDSNGNLLTVTDPLSHVTTTRTYNALNQVLTDTDGLSHADTMTYSAAGRLLTVTDALSHTTVTNTYSTAGLLLTSTDGISEVTTFDYDADGNCDEVTDPNGNTVSRVFNSLGVMTSQTDGRSIATSYTLDAWHRVTGVTRNSITLATTVYDANSNVTSVTDANSHATTTVFDAANRVTSVTKANGDVMTYTWDATGKKGLLSSKTNGNSQTTTYAYTHRNQLSSVSYPDSTSESWTYNANEDKVSRTDGKNQTTNYVFDDAGRMTSVDYPSGTDVSFTFDNADRKTQMVDSTGTTTWAYDNADRLTSITAPNGTVSYTYNNRNARTQVSLTGTGNWTYTFDDGGRLTGTTNPYSESSAFSYDAANRLTQTTAGNTSVTAYSYDNLNRQTDVWHKTSGGTTLSRHQYTYNNGGLVTQRDDHDGSSTAFGYDNANQLTSEVRTGTGGNNYSISYTYDDNGNRTSKTIGGVTDTYTIGNNDRLTSTSSKSYTYDNNGNVTAVTSGGQTTSLTYDFENRVTQITYPNASTNTFQYNGLNLRTRKVDSTGTVNFVTDGSTPASPVLADTNATYTPGLSERRGGTSKFLHGDALGSTRGITAANQSSTDTVLYDAFGQTVNRTGTTATPFGFVGAQEYQTDSNSGLMLLGHRYYDSSIGRFITRDPAKDGDNWYVYCENDPVADSDPEGLQRIIGPIVRGLRNFKDWIGRGGGGRQGRKGGELIRDVPKIKIPAPPPGMSNAQFGDLVGWGGKGEEALKRMREISVNDIRGFIDRGVTREKIREWAEFYRDTYRRKKEQNAQDPLGNPAARAKLLYKIYDHWPKK